MRRSIVILLLVGLIGCGLLTACGQNANQSGTVALAEPTALPTSVEAVTDYASFGEALRADGVVFAPEGDVAQSFLQVKGTILRVDSQRIQVYEYPDSQSASADAARFSLDGAWVNSDIGATLVNWIATPHLYRASRLIALYVGDSPATLTLLDALLGSQFAGGANPYYAIMTLTEN